MSIARRILIAVLGGLLPLVAALAAAAAEVRATIRHEVLEGLDRIADMEQAALTQTLRTAHGGLGVLVDEYLSPLVTQPPDGGAAQPDGGAAQPDGAAVRPDRAAVTAALEDLVGRDPSVLRAASLFEPDGSPVAWYSRSGVAPLAVEPADVRAALNGPLLGRAYRAADQDDRFQLLLPVTPRSGGAAAAVVAVECDLNPIVGPLIDASRFGDARTAEAHLVQRVDDGGAEIISPLKFKPGAEFTTVVPRTATGTPAIQALQGHRGVVEGLRDYRDVEVVAAFREIEDTPWALVVKMDRSEAFSRYERMTSTLGVVGVAVLVLLVGSLGFAYRSVSRRLGRVTELAEAISRGDLSRRIGRHTEDEFGRLSQAFDNMADTLAADIERRRQVEIELHHRARHDDLTGLPGRVVAYDVLTDALEDPSQRVVGLLFCDLDSFKTVNDELGHSAGDSLLQQVADRLRLAVGPAETVARFGGDEFVVVCQHLDRPEAVGQIAEKMRSALSIPFNLAGRSVVVTASIGSTVVDTSQPTTAEALLRDADAAMYRAKELGRNRHVALDDETRLRASVALSAVINLRGALADGSLELRYQPVVDLRRNTVYGVEALLRRAGQAGVPADPFALVALAEASGLALELDQWVFATACGQLRRLVQDGLSGLCMSVNVSATSLGDPTMVPFLLDTVAANGLSPQRLCLELTEVAVHRDDETAGQLRRLREAGFRIAIDDFGMGYSNLHRLRQLPVDVLKVDRSFLTHLATDPAARQIVASVMQLGDALGLSVVAEGVEDTDQVAVLSELGCRLAQGYLYAAALDAAQLTAFVNDACRQGLLGGSPPAAATATATATAAAA
ncbi:MAG: GGDEF domain-containing protein [Acidimicrobiales bacterium]